MSDTPLGKGEKIEIPHEVTPEVAAIVSEVLANHLAGHGFEVQLEHAAEDDRADIVIRNEGGDKATFQLKIVPDERIAEARDTLQQIRERNQSTEQRLQRLRKRLVVT